MAALLSTLLHPRLLRPLFWVLLAVAVFFALDPRPPSLPIDRLGDKFAHMLAFAVLTGVALLAWPRIPAMRIALALSALGALIEWLQAIPALHRTSDWQDWAVDSAAIIVTALAVRAAAKRFAPDRALP